MPYEVTVLACNKLKAEPWKFIIITCVQCDFINILIKLECHIC